MFNRHNTSVLRSRNLSLRDVESVLTDMRNRNLDSLFISSPGGDADIIFYGIEHLMPRKITVIAGNMVHSAALDIFLCGNSRLALPDSSFHFHEVGFTRPGKTRLCKTEIEIMAAIALHEGRIKDAMELSCNLAICQELDIMTAQLIQKRTRLTANMVMKLMRGHGCMMSAQEALFYGLVHRIVDYSEVVI